MLEIDPLTHGVVWDFHDQGTEKFLSNTCGTSRRLENGNTLITESDNGHAFEVTKDYKFVSGSGIRTARVRRTSSSPRSSTSSASRLPHCYGSTITTSTRERMTQETMASVHPPPSRSQTL